MDGLDYWRLCDEIDVHHAALLIIGLDPSGESQYCDDWKVHEQPMHYHACMTALKNAILSRKLPATIRRDAWERGWDEEPSDGERYAESVQSPDLNSDALSTLQKRDVIYRVEPNWRKTTIQVSELKSWLAERGFRTGFFFPQATDIPDHLDPNHPRYSSKLAAALTAWINTTDAPGRTPKQRLEKWLRENAAKFGLTDEEGKFNETAIDECAKVANWKPQGGVAGTPTGKPTPQSSR